MVEDKFNILMQESSISIANALEIVYSSHVLSHWITL